MCWGEGRQVVGICEDWTCVGLMEDHSEGAVQAKVEMDTASGING